MREQKFKSLIEKLNAYIDIDGVDPSVSPTLGSDGVKSSGPLFITANMDVDRLSSSQLLLTHTLLHRFYTCGGIKNLNKKDIEKLHGKIAKKIKHVSFDKLDKK